MRCDLDVAKCKSVSGCGARSHPVTESQSGLTAAGARCREGFDASARDLVQGISSRTAQLPLGEVESSWVVQGHAW